MSKRRITKLSFVVGAAFLPALTLNGCVTVKNFYQQFTGIDTSTRETTGYYGYMDSKLAHNNIVVPDGLDDPGFNSQLAMPVVDVKKLQGPTGEDMDIRPPTAPLRVDIGIHSQWLGGEAFVWFENGGEHGIRTEDDAWMLLSNVLKNMKVGVGKLVDGQYILTTIARDYSFSGKPYDAVDDDRGILRYNQIYQIRVGRNSYGELGIGTKLIGSSTSLSNGVMMEDKLDIIEQERFAMGFSNNIIHELDHKTQSTDFDPDNLIISLDRDSNNHVAVMVEAPFETVMSLMNATLPLIQWKVVKYSVERAEYEIEIQEVTDGYYRRTGLPRPPNMPSANYKIRVGIEGPRCSITFYDSKDNPLTTEVADIYPLLSKGLAKSFRDYSDSNSHKIKVD